jgi:oxygen-independent coproporphyrinogen III oxidase
MSAKRPSNMTGAAGIYVHAPFCIKKCPYCDFYSTTDVSLIPAFTEAVVLEIKTAVAPASPFDSIYFGGGTPSLLDPAQIRSIIGAAYEKFDVLADCEITLEANPGTVSFARLREYRAAGVNRITIGVQSFSDENLSFLGRIHSSEDARQAIAMTRNAGFDNLGLDLIYGLPSQNVKSWGKDLEDAVDFKPEHLSCYMLTCEAGTRLDVRRKQGRFVPLDEETAKTLFETTRAFLSVHGYDGYEISNFSRIDPSLPGPEREQANRSRHNPKYWTGAPYLGFGPAAHSYVEPCRSWNIKSLRKYIDLIREGKLSVEEKEILTEGQQMIEAVYLGLRTSDGIDIEKFNSRFNVSFYRLFKEIIDRLQTQKLIKTAGSRCSLTPKGMLVSDAVSRWFADCI